MHMVTLLRHNESYKSEGRLNLEEQDWRPNFSDTNRGVHGLGIGPIASPRTGAESTRYSNRRIDCKRSDFVTPSGASGAHLIWWPANRQYARQALSWVDPYESFDNDSSLESGAMKWNENRDDRPKALVIDHDKLDVKALRIGLLMLVLKKDGLYVVGSTATGTVYQSSEVRMRKNVWNMDRFTAPRARTLKWIAGRFSTGVGAAKRWRHRNKYC